MSFMDKEKRSVCWKAKDTYWECLDKHHLEPGQGGPCAQLRKLYEAGCPAQWVKHFDRKRSYLQFKEKIEKDGYEPLNDKNSSFKSS